MSDPFVPRRKIYRKRRKSEGQTWSPDTEELLRAKLGNGLLCKTCRKTRKWQKLQVSYDTIKGTVSRVWSCDQCGDVLRIDEVGSYNSLLTRKDEPASIASSTDPPPGKEPKMSEPRSAKEAAIELGTDARTLRKFLRSNSSPFEPVGQGSRYTFDDKEMTKLKKAFVTWGNGSSRKKSEKQLDAEALAENALNDGETDDPEEAMRIAEDYLGGLDDLDGPDEDELMELEDLELEDLED